MSEYALRIKNISRNFPGVKALDDVSFDIKKGDLHALVGENGAGKSTLIKILSGVYFPDGGSLELGGAPFAPATPLHAQQQGISIVHQELKLINTLTVMENIFLGRPVMGRLGVDWKKMKRQAQELLSRLNIDLDPEALVSQLSVAQQQIVEICKALSYNADIIIMDEPSATLTDKELETLFNILRDLRSQGITIIYISHRLEEIFKLADTVTVLRDGTHVITCPVEEVNRERLISYMVGRELGMEFPEKTATIGEPILEVKSLSRKGMFQDISFTLHRGEILGLAGLVGAGRTEVARAIFGADKGVSGEIKVKGEPYDTRGVHSAIERGIGLIPEDRKAQGLVLDMSVKENTSMANFSSITTTKVLSAQKEENLARRFIGMLKISTPDSERKVKFLSGGNQQKVVIAKWLNADCDILLVDEPTRGIDVGAKMEIYKLLGELAEQGKSILMISSDMPELIGVCDRMLVMSGGRLTGEILAEDATQEIILSYAIM